MRTPRLASFLTIVTVLVSATARADIVILKDGRKIEGEVVEKTAAKVVVKTKFGTSEFKTAEVERIDPKNTPDQELAARRAKIDPNNVDQLFELYEYAKEQKLKSKSNEILREIVKLDPEHEAARKELGYVKYKDKWLSEADAKKQQKADEDAEMKAQGLVQYKGKWVTPEARDAVEHEAKGEVLVDGKWVNKKELDRVQAEAKQRDEAREHKLKGEYFVNGAWVAKTEAEKHYSNIATPYRTEGDHVLVLTNKGIDLGERVLVEAEKAYRDCASVFGVEPDLHGKRMPVYVTATVQECNDLAQQLGADEKSSLSSAWCSPWLPAHPDGFEIVSATMFYQDTITDVYARHATAEQFLQRLVGKDATDIPSLWFVDGFSSYIERWKKPGKSNGSFGWSRERLRSLGALMNLKSFVGNYQPALRTEQNVLQGGLLVAFLLSDKASPELKTAFKDAIEAIKAKGKVGKAFKKLDKALQTADDAFLEFADSPQG